MNQDAFRNLLKTAESTRPIQRARIQTEGTEHHVNSTSTSGSKSKVWKPRPKAVIGASSALVSGSNELSSSKVQFRDRAEERRKGLYAEEDEAEEALYKSMGVEESKFLGGDLAHTHLVKGLDFALLAKMRREADQQSKSSLATTTDDLGRQHQTMSSQSSQSLDSISSLKGVSANVVSTSIPKMKESSLSSSSQFGKSILEAVASSLRQFASNNHSRNTSVLSLHNSHSRFFPGRTTFSYSCAANNASSDSALLFSNLEEAESLPTILTREVVSFENAANRTFVVDHPNPDIEDCMLEAFFKHHIGTGKRKRIKNISQTKFQEEHAGLNSKTSAITMKKKEKDMMNDDDDDDDDDDDIFSGAGTYAPSSSATFEAQQTTSPQQQQSLVVAAVVPIQKEMNNQDTNLTLTHEPLNLSSLSLPITKSLTQLDASQVSASSSLSSSSSTVVSLELKAPMRVFDPLLRYTLDHGVGGLAGFDEWDVLENSSLQKESLAEQRRKAEDLKVEEIFRKEKSSSSFSTSSNSNSIIQKSLYPVTSKGLTQREKKNTHHDYEDTTTHTAYANELMEDEDIEEGEDPNEKDILKRESHVESHKHINARNEDELLDEQIDRHISGSSSGTVTTSSKNILPSSSRPTQIDSDILALRSGSFSMLGGAREEAIAAATVAKAATRTAKAAAMAAGRKQQQQLVVASASESASMSASFKQQTLSSWRPGNRSDGDGDDDDDDDDGHGSVREGGARGSGNKKAKIDTELIQINRILEDRKSNGGGGGVRPMQPSLKHKKGKNYNQELDEE